MTPLLPWRPAILSPGCSLRFTATNTLTIFEHARRQLVAALELLDAVLEALDDDVGRLVILRLQRLDVGLALVVLDGDLPPVVLLGRLEHRVVDGRALLDALRRRGRDLLRAAFP